jgi:hypothetical protein
MVPLQQLSPDNGRFGEYSSGTMKPNLKTTLAATALALLSITPAVSAGEVVTLTWKKTASDAENAKTATIELGVGESIKALWGGVKEVGADQTQNHTRVRLSFTKEGENSTTSLVDLQVIGSSFGGAFGGLSAVPFELAGPAVIRVIPFREDTGTSTATFAVTRVGTASPPAEVPQEAGSNFDVILEQSSDLVNWTPANPGTYSGTETKRFFRTRIVKK